MLTSSCLRFFPPCFAKPRPATRVFRALRARSVPGLSPRMSPKTGVSEGVSEGVSHGVSPELFGPQLQSVQVSRECPESVPGVAKTQCVPDTSGTLSRHTPETPRGTLSQTPPVFGDTLGDIRGTLRKGPKDSCSRPGGSQAL